MKQTSLTQAATEVIELKLKIADEFIEEIIKPLGDIGNPEKLLGKPYEEWSPAELQMLSQIYGTEDDTALAKLIFDKSYKEVQELEEV